MKRDFEYIYGPVASWRLGSSLGIDPISQPKKICTFDCIYCQLGSTAHFTDSREEFVSIGHIIEELRLLPSLSLDYITFSGAGEPTLAENLGQMIRVVKRIMEEKVAVITNSSLLSREDVQEDLYFADFVVAKLDACSVDLLERINRPMKTIQFEAILKGLKKFKLNYSGKLALQIMFIEENKNYAGEIARIVGKIQPDEVQINTPLRQCEVKPLSKEKIEDIRGCFFGQNVISVYEVDKKSVESLSTAQTLKRRGKT